MKLQYRILIIILFLIIGCTSNKYPESYGVYLAENMKPIKSNVVKKYYLETINFEDINYTTNKSPVSLWFYDPKIIPTDLKLEAIVNAKHNDNIAFNTKPIDGKTGLFKIELIQPAKYGIYFLNNYINHQNHPDNSWIFIVGENKSSSSYKKELIGKWNVDEYTSAEFFKNGTIDWNGEVIGKYEFIGQDSLNLSFEYEGNLRCKIHLISDNLLLYSGKTTSGDTFSMVLFR